MAEEVQEATPAPEPSPLEKVYQQYKVDDVAETFRPEPRPQPSVETPQAQPQPATGIPDPILQADQFRAFSGNQQQELATLKQSLSQLQSQFGSVVAQSIKAREEADIRSAVDTVKKAGFDAKDNFIEIALGVKAREDPRFMSLYQNRGKNPQAWGAALQAVASELKSQYEFRADPQLTENARAAKASVQSTPSPSKTSESNPLEDRLNAAKTPGEWDAVWQQIVSGGR